MGKGSFVASRGRSHEHTEEVRDLPPRVQGGRLAADREPRARRRSRRCGPWARARPRRRFGDLRRGSSDTPASSGGGSSAAPTPSPHSRSSGGGPPRSGSRSRAPQRPRRRTGGSWLRRRSRFFGPPLRSKTWPSFCFWTQNLVISLHAQWLALRQRTALWLGQPPPPAPGPRYDHEANADGSCCPAHTAARMMTESK